MFEEPVKDAVAQADIPEPQYEDQSLKIRPLERIKLHPKVPEEPSSYGKYKNYSQPWILIDGRGIPGEGSVMRDSYVVPPKAKKPLGIRRRMLNDFFWEQMLDEIFDEMGTNDPVTEYCSEYDANYVKDDFEPRNLEHTRDLTTHLKYPLYGTGSSAITFYSETITKVGGEILEKFRKTQEFTRPMEERLDDGWVL